MVNVIITAGGVGSRMKLNVPKQFYEIDGVPLIALTIKKFQEHPLVDRIYIVCLNSHMSLMNKIVERFSFSKVTDIVAGGANGQESIFNGLQAIPDDPEGIVIVHDGNRPLVSDDVITDCIDTVIAKGNAIAQVTCKEALLVVDGEESSVTSYPRDNVRRTQTPHGFMLSELKEAHSIANRLGIKNTIASCTLFQSLSKRVYFSRGEEKNIKITTPDDLEVLKMYLKMEN